jgi:hypothetical protein
MMVDVGYGRKQLQQYHGVYDGFEHQWLQTFKNLPIGKTNCDEFKFVAYSWLVSPHFTILSWIFEGLQNNWHFP